MVEEVSYYKSPFGWWQIESNGREIVRLVKVVDMEYLINDDSTVVIELKRQLDEYFVGSRKSFDIALNPQGTEFQKLVWNTLLKIPYGARVSYKEVAIIVGKPKACRAVGMANNKNPIAILIPCHRVIGAKGELVGYNGGVEVKKKLLELENE
ncbi:MAG: methylated-DNA--[protein]-cysteine S-methyltransferase [Alphaproteobacteria bacterium]